MLEQGSNAELQLQLKKKEQELEHKLNTLIALNEKLQVFNDIKKDLAENKQIVRQSEDARGKLQITIKQTAQKLKEDTEMKEKFQESLQSKINELMQEIQQCEQQAHHTAQIHLDQLNEQDKKHHDEMLKRNKEYADLRDKFVAREQEWLKQKGETEEAFAADLNQKADEAEQLDKWYREQLEAEMERNRQEVADLERHYNQQFDKQDQDFVNQLNAITDKHAKEMAEQQSRFARELKDYQTRQADAFQKQENDFISQITSLTDKHRREFS